MFKNITGRDVLKYFIVVWLLHIGLLFWEFSFNSGKFPIWTLILFISTVLLVLFLIYRKLILNFTILREESRDGFAQITPLLYLHSQISFRKALPRMRSYAASPDVLVLIVDTIKKYQPQTIIECGSGVSTIVEAYILEQNNLGHIYSLEDDANFAQLTNENLLNHHLEQFATVLYAPLEDVQINGESWKWYNPATLNHLKSIDLLFVDGPKSTSQRNARYPALPMLFDRLSDRAMIIVDDCIRKDDKDTIERWIKEFNLNAQWYPTEKGTCILSKKS